MDFKKLVLTRESVRKYTDQIIEREDLLTCVDAARMSPSACNSQPWKYIIIDDRELALKVEKETFNSIMKFNKFTLNAPVIVVVVMEKTNISSSVGSIMTDTEYNFIDLGISVENFCLQAADLGIGTCILGYYKQNTIKKLLNIPSNKRIGLLITMGYSANEKPRVKQRNSVEDMSSFNTYK